LVDGRTPSRSASLTRHFSTRPKLHWQLSTCEDGILMCRVLRIYSCP